MPDHEVQLRAVPSLSLRHSDMVFDVRFGDDLLGSLRISRGNVVWRPVGNSYGYWLRWGNFGTLLVQNGKRRKVNF